MKGTLQATLVPYDTEHALHEATVSALDQHSGSYPISGEIWVGNRLLPLKHYNICDTATSKCKHTVGGRPQENSGFLLQGLHYVLGGSGSREPPFFL